ncbi:MAG: hypothetical protein EAZ18_25130, partial [Oscillatoriales cyanobacterium]
RVQSPSTLATTLREQSSTLSVVEGFNHQAPWRLLYHREKLLFQDLWTPTKETGFFTTSLECNKYYRKKPGF